MFLYRTHSVKFQEVCYPMRAPSLGHAVIINNVASEFPGTRVDAASLEETYRIMGFTVTMASDCSGKVKSFQSLPVS